eukprot:CAMPEP_0119470308 /NCGR_PEP_ID=MMETSP1344-20130328/3266_1 /TAXON_ID=236787 /ORGANISM="Florenciella parvula, Strain CCMP2471" /LENGTH=73 /DNA_ID=CAMNT_0007502965 /DNA_START=6 /DNA_END=227 /DNA_ORIENTATION=+
MSWISAMPVSKMASLSMSITEKRTARQKLAMVTGPHSLHIDPSNKSVGSSASTAARQDTDERNPYAMTTINSR